VIVALVEILFAGSGWLAHRRRRAAAS